MGPLRLLFFSTGIFILLTLSASADSFTTYTETLTTTAKTDGANGVTFTVTFVADTTKDTFTMKMAVESSTAASLDDFTLSLLGGGKNASITVPKVDFTAPSTAVGWTYGDNTKINNSPGSFGCIAKNGFGGWLCATGTGTALMLKANTLYNFQFSGSYVGTVTAPFDLMADGFVGTTHFGVSRLMTPTTPVVPEPSSLVLLGSGLVGMGFLVRRKLGL